MKGIIYRIDDLENAIRMPMFTVTCDEMLLTPSIVFEYFKQTKKKYKIAGKRFTFLLGNRAYHIVKIRQAYRIFELGEFDGQLKITGERPESVHSEVGNDPE